MKWHGALALVCGLLLAVPLWLLIGGVSHGRPGLPTLAGKEISPVLTLDRTRSLLTFERPCRSSAECEAPLACLQDRRRVIEPRCVASECMTDMQCQTGFSCQTVHSLGPDGRWVRICTAQGTLGEGLRCSNFPRTREDACAPGFICQGWCGRACQVEEPSSCPAGSFCKESPNGASCVPTCEARGCPEGHQCVRVRDGISICARTQGDDCQRTPCRDGQRCKVGPFSADGEEVILECVTPCEEDVPSCPEGALCFYGNCRRPCAPDTPGACGPRETCLFHPVEKLWMCQLR
jgi:hypothetical protein